VSVEPVSPSLESTAAPHPAASDIIPTENVTRAAAASAFSLIARFIEASKSRRQRRLQDWV
jgi:hypothetical protein